MSNYTEAVDIVLRAASNSVRIDWYAFLARPRLPPPMVESLEQLRDTRILITGAGGSIGGALSVQLAALGSRRLVLLDASEQAVYRLQLQLAANASPTRPSVVLANIGDSAHLDEIFEIHRPQLVFHAAAYKHVPLLEEHPFEAIANNALGTLTLTECAQKWDVGRIVLLSTDKAVMPISMLGATKRIAELIVLANYGVAVRLANVLGTEGSVSEAFLHQIAAGGLVKITSRDAERYFLTREEAVDLLLTSAVTATAGSLLAPYLSRQHNIVSLAEFLVSACSYGVGPEMVFTGLRPGDKISESLWSREEQPRFADARGYFEIIPRPLEYPPLHRNLAGHLAGLRHAVLERDLRRALDIVLNLVPDYQPGASVLALLQRAGHGALQS